MNIGEIEIVEIDETPPQLDLTPKEVETLADELVKYHAEFADLFYRKEQAHWSYKYMQGLMAPLEKKMVQPMAMALEGGDIQAMQQFIGQGRWQDEQVLRKHWQLVDETLGEEDGVWIVDESGFPKKGEHSVGVARQWCGQLGKVENCQVGVFTAYASSKGYTLLDARLYLPEVWFGAEADDRCEKCGVPEDITFHTKPELALDMLKTVIKDGSLRFRWITCDETYGRDTTFLDGVAALDGDYWYFAEVPHDTQVWETRPKTAVPEWSGQGRKPSRVQLVDGEPKAERVDAIAAAIPADGWRPYLIKEGSKGPMVAYFAIRRIVTVRDGLPGPDACLVLRHSVSDTPELKTYLSNAPGDTPHAEFARVAGMRWPVGLGWHHHMTLCILSHHFLVRLQLQLKRGSQR
jgi:SRSO17 transposase